MTEFKFVQVLPVIKKYEWGKREVDALTKVFSKNIGFSMDDEEGFLNDPYAELWYGSHTSNPSKVVRNNQILENKTIDDIISFGSVNRINEKLPFILKVLSISKPLSLQVHPDEHLAKELHFKNPEKYPDDKHKPEIAIALTEFEAFCGFQSTSEIINNIKRYPELRILFGFKDEYLVSKDKNQENTQINDQDPNHNIKKEIFINMLNADSDTVEKIISKVISRIESTRSEERSFIDNLIIRINEYFPLNIGVICPIFLNYIKLKPGDAIFIGSGTIHSYISGECIECMTNSDNVIRCGLTPKFKDIPNLIRAVNFQRNNCRILLHNELISSKDKNSILINKTTSVILNDYSIDNIKEFCVKILNFNPKIDPFIEMKTPAHYPSLILCLNGNSDLLIEDEKSCLFQGKSIFVNSNVSIKITPKNLTDEYIKLVLVTISI